jgi:hypothetical protein
MARIQLSGTQIPTLSKLNIDGEFTLDASAGNSGEILTSAGSGNTPTWNSSISVSGDIITTTGKLQSTASSGDEGGEIFLNKSVTNTTLNGGVTIDVYQNKLRFFEQGGTARGYYIDISGGGAGVATNLAGTATDTNYYPSAIVFNAGTTAGPTLDLTMSGSGAPDLTAVAIPSAGASASGIVTTGSQTFAGTKTFSSSIDTPGIARSGTSALTLSTANASTATGSITLSTGNVTSSGASGSISIDVGSSIGGGGPGSVTIGTTNASAITIGKTGLNISTPGGIDATQTIAGGNLTTGGTLTRTILAGGGATTASIDNNGRFIRTTSSSRYKQDIQNAEFIYDDVLLLTPKTFRLKDEAEEDPNSRVYGGLIAEDVHEIESLKVFVNYLTQEDGSKIPDGIAYGEMVSALVSAIKHQDTLIKSLETRIEQLENQ